MPLKIDFYLARAANFQQCQTLCLQLAQYEFESGCNINIYFNMLEYASQVDQALWANEPTSFLPHLFDQEKSIIQLGRPNIDNNKVQVNMRTDRLQLDNNIIHLIQIIPDNELDKKAARNLYRQLQSQGHKITVHKDA